MEVPGQPEQKERPHLNIKKIWLWCCVLVIPAMARTIVVQVGLGKKQDSISKITRKKKDWRYGSSSRAPA
jgi:hypothetical protein